MIITEPLKVDLPFIDTNSRRNSVAKECYLILGEKHIDYKVVSEYESNDNDNELWEPKIANYRFTRKRIDITDVSMYYDNPNKTWFVALDFNGVSDPVGWNFHTPKEALLLYNKLREYFTTQ